MEHKPISLEEFNSASFCNSRQRVERLFDDFMESQDQVWQITEWLDETVDEDNCFRCASGARYYTYSMPYDIKVTVRGKKLYLVKE